MHPNDEVLLTIADSDVREARGDVESAAIAAAREHLAAPCAECVEKTDQYRELKRALAGEPIADPPPAWIAAAVALGAPRRVGATETPTEVVQRWVDAVRAVLVQDLRPNAALSGVRGEASLTHHQLLYRSRLGSVHISLARLELGGATLQGQLLPSVDGVAVVDGRLAWRAGKASGDARLSPHGEFGPFDLPAGPLSLELDWEGGRIVVDDLTV